MIIPTILIQSKDFHDAWYQMNSKILRDGFEIPSDQTEAKLTKDVCCTIELTGEAIDQIIRHELHQDYPMKHGLKSYVNQFMYNSREFLESDASQEYTYAGRMLPDAKILVEELPRKLYDRGTQLTTWNKYRDLGNEVRPCFQRMWVRKLTDDTCELHLTYRSHDVFAWQFNMIALVDYATQYVTHELEIVKIVEFNDSLHVYDYDYEASRNISKPTVDFRRAYE